MRTPSPGAFPPSLRPAGPGSRTWRRPRRPATLALLILALAGGGCGTAERNGLLAGPGEAPGPAGWVTAEDGSCRLPLPAGAVLRDRSVPGGPFYDALSDRIVQRPATVRRELWVSGRPAAVLSELRGGVYPVFNGDGQAALLRVMADYQRTVFLEDGRYRLERRSTAGGDGASQRLTLVCTTEYGSSKRLEVELRAIRDGGGDALAVTVVETQGDAVEVKGFKAKVFGRIVVAGYAAWVLTEPTLFPRVGGALRGMIEGLAVQGLAPNPALARWLVGNWESAETAGSSTVGGRYEFSPGGTYRYRATVSSGFGSGISGPESGTWEVFGRILVLVNRRGEVATFPLQVTGGALRIGGRFYGRG
ncbi:MAG: hypothetical protein KA419_16425 [Acidobacteria bacterium]|nr:hypothetical protein [Acidobacteriota bacterium]